MLYTKVQSTNTDIKAKNTSKSPIDYYIKREVNKIVISKGKAYKSLMQSFNFISKDI